MDSRNEKHFVKDQNIVIFSYEHFRNTINEIEALLEQIKSNEQFKLKITHYADVQNGLIEHFRRLQDEQKKLKEAIVHANVLRNYTTEQKQAKSQFLKEMQSLQPEGIHGGNKTRMY